MVRRFTATSRLASKPRDSVLNFSNRFEIWQTPRQQRCRIHKVHPWRYSGCGLSQWYRRRWYETASITVHGHTRDDNIIDCPLDGAKEWSRSRRMAIMLGSGVDSPWKRGHLVNIFRCDVSVEIIEMIGYLEIKWYANLPYPGTSVIYGSVYPPLVNAILSRTRENYRAIRGNYRVIRVSYNVMRDNYHVLCDIKTK